MFFKKLNNKSFWKKYNEQWWARNIAIHGIWYFFEIVCYQMMWIKNTSREVTSGDKGAENYLDSGHLLLHFYFWHFQKCHFQNFSEMTIRTILTFLQIILILTLSKMTLLKVYELMPAALLSFYFFSISLILDLKLPRYGFPLVFEHVIRSR